MSRRREVVFDVLASLGRHALSAVAGIVTLACVGRVLGAEALGAWTTVGTMSFMIGIAELGLSTSIQRAEIGGAPGASERALGTALRTIGVVAPVLAVGAAFALRGFFGAGVQSVTRADLVWSCAFAILGGLVAAPGAPIRALLLVRGRVRIIAVARAVAALVQLAVAAGGLMLTRRLLAAAIALAAAQALEVVLLVVLGRTTEPELRRFPRGASDRVELFGFIRDAFATLVVNASSLLSTRLDVMLLAAYRPLREVAAYAVAARAIDQALLFAKQSSNAMLGRIGNPETRDEGMRVGAATLGAVGASGLVAIAVLGQPVLKLWVGDAARYETLGVMLGLLAISGVLTTLNEVPASALMLGARSPWQCAVPIVVGTLLNVTITVLAIPSLGGVGAALGTVAGYSLCLLLIWWQAGLVGWRMRYAVPAVVAGSAALVSALVIRPFAADGGRALLGCLIVSSIGVAAAALVFWRSSAPQAARAAAAAVSSASTTST